MIIDLIVGDWSGDGHSKTDQYMYHISCTQEVLTEWFDKGLEIIGIEWNFCEDYDDNIVPHEVLNALKFVGFDPSKLDGADDVDDISDGIGIHGEEFANLFMFVAWIGSGKILEYELIKNKYLHIGGYGLFYT